MSEQKLQAMQEGGQIAALVLKETLKQAKVGVSTFDLDEYAEKRILELQATPAFKGYEGYKFATCINLNDGLVHGIPKQEMILKSGDIVTVDLGVKYRGYITDCAWTAVVGESKKASEFLLVGKKALKEAIYAVRVGGWVLDISRAIQRVVEEAGYNAVRDLVGHAVGEKLHEEPMVPCFYDKRFDRLVGELKEGMTLAIEVMYTEGHFSLVTDDDNWTMRTKDGKLCALFEETVYVGSDGPLILTKLDG